MDPATTGSPAVPDVVSATQLSNSFLGNLIEVCFATEDYKRTMEGMVRLGIGPRRVYTFDGSTVSDREYAGSRPTGH
jgi:methylmalonyl-CoA/ethylmalonyl-CoA epimerase